MIDLNIEIKGINKLKDMYARRPDVVKQYMNKAIAASVFEIEKQAVDSNFQFNTPRALRTGYLQRSFKFGIILGDLQGAIGPTAEYAPMVHKRNQFMPRIARASQPYVEKHFNQALKLIIEDLGK
jgi:hypothetical protein